LKYVYWNKIKFNQKEVSRKLREKKILIKKKKQNIKCNSNDIHHKVDLQEVFFSIASSIDGPTDEWTFLNYL
jgi:hypothetical protein